MLAPFPDTFRFRIRVLFRDRVSTAPASSMNPAAAARNTDEIMEVMLSPARGTPQTYSDLFLPNPPEQGA